MELTIIQLAELADELNRVYDKREAPEIAWAALIPDGHIDFDGRARTVWIRVVKEAGLLGEHVVTRLVERAAREYDRPALQDLLAAVRHQPSPTVDSPDSTPTAGRSAVGCNRTSDRRAAA